MENAAKALTEDGSVREFLGVMFKWYIKASDFSKMTEEQRNAIVKPIRLCALVQGMLTSVQRKLSPLAPPLIESDDNGMLIMTLKRENSEFLGPKNVLLLEKPIVVDFSSEPDIKNVDVHISRLKRIHPFNPIMYVVPKYNPDIGEVAVEMINTFSPGYDVIDNIKIFHTDKEKMVSKMYPVFDHILAIPQENIVNPAFYLGRHMLGMVKAGKILESQVWLMDEHSNGRPNLNLLIGSRQVPSVENTKFNILFNFIHTDTVDDTASKQRDSGGEGSTSSNVIIIDVRNERTYPLVESRRYKISVRQTTLSTLMQEYVFRFLSNTEGGLSPDVTFKERLSDMFQDMGPYLNDAFEFRAFVDGATSFENSIRDLFLYESGPRTKEITGMIENPLNPLKSDKYVTLNFRFVQQNEDPVEIGVSVLKSMQTRMAIHKNLQNEPYSIVYKAGPGSVYEKLTIVSQRANYLTDNVKEMCSVQRMKRRAIPCQFLLKESEEDVEKLDNEEKLEHHTDNDDFNKYDLSERDAVRTKLIDMESNKLRLTNLKRTYLTKLHMISTRIQVGFMAKDILSDFSRGDFKSAFVDAAFVSGSIGLHKLGEFVGTKGASLIEKGASLSGKIISALGLCLPKLPFDLYLIKDLINSMEKGDVWHTISDGVMIGIDVIECLIDVLIITGVIAASPAYAAVLAVASSLTLITLNVHDTIKEVERINDIVHLNWVEKAEQSFRSFLHLNSEPLINQLLKEKEADSLIYNETIDNWQQSQSLKRILVSMGKIESKDDHTEKVKYLDDNQIDLRKVVQIKAHSRSMPDEIKGFKLFCRMSEEYEEIHKSLIDRAVSLVYNQIWGRFFNTADTLLQMINKWGHSSDMNYKHDYKCKNSFGIDFSNHNQTNATFYDLHDGEDHVFGFPHSANVFLLGNGPKFITGGIDLDHFKLTGSSCSGVIDGSDGYNILDISSLNNETQIMVLNEIAICKNIANSGTNKKISKKDMLQLKNIHDLRGRINVSDMVVCSCSLRNIQLNGGLDFENPDYIEIRTSNCSYNLTIALSRFTYLKNDATEGYFVYKVSDSSEDAVISIFNSDSTSHVFKFENVFDGYNFKIAKRACFIDLRIMMKDHALFIPNITKNFEFVFGDGVRMNFDDNSTVRIRTERNVGTVIEKYNDFSIRSDMTVIVQSTVDNETIVFSSNKRNKEISGTNDVYVMHNDPKRTSHLTAKSSASSNYFVIVGPSDNTLFEHFIVPTVEIRVSHKRYEQQQNYIDLEYLSAQVRRLGNYDLVTEINTDMSISEDIILDLYIASNSNGSNLFRFGNITVVNGHSNSVYTTLTIIHHSNKKIEAIQHPNQRTKYIMLSLPIIVDSRKNIVVIMPSKVDPYSTFIFEKSMGKCLYYRMVDSLMITNVPFNLEDESPLLTVILTDYFVVSKVRTVNLLFNQTLLTLNDIPHTAPVEDLWDLLGETTDFHI